MRELRVLYVAEITGRCGIACFVKGIEALKRKTRAGFVIACGDSATNGSGVGARHAGFLHKKGADIITTGDRCFFKQDLCGSFDVFPYVLRPFNLEADAPGRGSRVCSVRAPDAGGQNAGVPEIGVGVLLGQSFLTGIHAAGPFSRALKLVEKLRARTPVIIVDFHAATTAEKGAMFEILDGSCSAVIGSHTKVQTADERVLPGGTAVISDAGRTGSINSVGGAAVQPKISGYLTGIPDWTQDAWDAPEIQGVLVRIGGDGKALGIERIRESVAVAP